MGSSGITTAEMECAVAGFLNWRANLIVPNVTWGMDVHECDLLVCTRASYLWEVEIKVSKADLKKDAEKRHGHHSALIKHLYFAIPTYLTDCADLIPERAGIITVEHPARDDSWLGRRVRSVRKIREPQTNVAARPISEAQRYKLARLGAMRIWGLSNKLIKVAA
jgi:hypothetical protein